MKLICPACGAACAAEAWLNDSNARQSLLILLSLPGGVSRHIVSYMALFRPRTDQNLRWAKVLRLAVDLKALIDLPFVQWDRKVARPNKPEAWAKAMERMIEYPPKGRPLKNHNYLRAIAYEIADEMDRAQERRQIAAEQSGAHRDRRTVSDLERPTLAEMRQIRKERMGKGNK